jgi:hypothetical protein
LALPLAHKAKMGYGLRHRRSAAEDCKFRQTMPAIAAD